MKTKLSLLLVGSICLQACSSMSSRKPAPNLPEPIHPSQCSTSSNGQSFIEQNLKLDRSLRVLRGNVIASCSHAEGVDSEECLRLAQCTGWKHTRCKANGGPSDANRDYYGDGNTSKSAEEYAVLICQESKLSNVGTCAKSVTCETAY